MESFIAKRTKDMIERRKKGQTLQEIADHYHITRQRVSKILLEEKDKENALASRT